MLDVEKIKESMFDIVAILENYTGIFHKYSIYQQDKNFYDFDEHVEFTLDIDLICNKKITMYLYYNVANDQVLQDFSDIGEYKPLTLEMFFINLIYELSCNTKE